MNTGASLLARLVVGGGDLMAHVRGPGEPTKKGVPWDVCWEDADGRKRQKRFYDETKATKEAGRIEDALRRGENTDPAAGRKTFKAIAEDWLATKQKARKDTRARYRTILEQHAYPVWESRRIASITAADFGRFLEGLYTKPDGKPRPASGIERIMYPVRAVFAYALDEGYVSRDPCRKVHNPTAETLDQEPFEGIALSESQVRRLAVECGVRHPLGELIVWFVARTGVRAGELNRLNISHLHPKQHYVIVPGTKSRHSKGRRADYSTTLDSLLAPYLASHPRAEEPDAPLFFGREPSGTKELNPQRCFDARTFYKYTFKPAAKAVALPQVRLHDLRHTAGSWWVAAGLPIEEVSEQLGHADINFTKRVYIHELQARRDRNRRLLDEYDAQQAALPNNVIPIGQMRRAS